MRIQGAVLGVVIVGVLVGCAAPQPDPTAGPSDSPTPTAEVAAVGEAAIPLGCSDLLAVADVADLGPDFDEPLSLAVDEGRIAVDLSVAELQLGALRCAWAARYGASDLHPVIELTIAPSTVTELTPGDEESFSGEFAPVDGMADTLIACAESFVASSDDPTLFNQCDIAQLRTGYRIDLHLTALRASEGTDSSVALDLLSQVDAAVDGAGPARVIEPVAATTDPASVCQGPEIAPLLEHVAATGDPAVDQHETYSTVTTCTWAGEDEYGNPIGPWVSVLPGGAWAIPRLATGVSSPFLPTQPSADGSYVFGVGEGVSVWRAVGDDLVYFVSSDFAVQDGWESFLESAW
jgi:hypothetical protein